MKGPEGAPGKPGSRATTVHADRIWDEAWSANAEVQEQAFYDMELHSQQNCPRSGSEGCGVAFAPTFPRGPCSACKPSSSGLPSKAGGELHGTGAQQPLESSEAFWSGDAANWHSPEQGAMGSSEGFGRAR